MTITSARTAVKEPQHSDRIFVDGAWTAPRSRDSFEIVDSTTEEPFMRVALGNAEDMSAAVDSARRAFDTGTWPRMTHQERADFLRKIAAGIRARAAEFEQYWPRQTGILHSIAVASVPGVAATWDFYADLAGDYPFEELVEPTAGGEFGLLSREPVGVVGAIIPWNGPIANIAYKAAPALIAGCTVVVKASPEAPAEAYLMAEIAEEIGLPPGVFNVVVADREVSELLVRDSRVDKISFTGSTAAGRRIASICGERIARTTLELGGKSAAVVLDDADIWEAAAALARDECFISGQVCSSLTRIIVSRSRHDELVDALAASFAKVSVGDPFEQDTEMGPLAMRRQLERVEGYIASGVEDGAVLATGGGRPESLDRGFFVEPTVFGGVDNSWRIAREEIFGPVLSVIPALDEKHAVQVANDSIYGLNASVFTPDPERALAFARQLRSGTVGHNAFRSDFGVSFGGFKQSGIGREGGREGLAPYLETKLMILNETPSRWLDR
jgi:acyl-CoA reductase-like NAD-dependent aldehyde dehydrogenase